MFMCFAHSVIFEVHPQSLNVSVNQAAKFLCSASNHAQIVWIWCSALAQKEIGDCEPVKHLSTKGSNTIVDPENIDSYNQLTILITDDLYLLNELNNSLLYCRALPSGSSFVNSLPARLLIQGRMNANNDNCM